jgi:uncharacterized protein YjbI with pentapeptide repeats
MGRNFRARTSAGRNFRGSSLGRAALEATDLSYTYLWRTNLRRTNLPTPPSTIAAIRMSDENWRPEWQDEHDKKQRWDDKAY